MVVAKAKDITSDKHIETIFYIIVCRTLHRPLLKLSGQICHKIEKFTSIKNIKLST